MYQHQRSSNSILKKPSNDTLNHLAKVLSQDNLGVYVDGVYKLDWTMLAVIVAAYDQILFNTPTGREIVAENCNMDIEDGDSDVEYEIPDTRELVRGDEVKILSTFFINGRFVKKTHVDTYHMERKNCDSCMGDYHCSKSIKDEYGKQVDMCNHCVSHSEVSRIRDIASDCARCSVKSCTHHPENLAWIMEKRLGAM